MDIMESYDPLGLQIYWSSKHGKAFSLHTTTTPCLELAVTPSASKGQDQYIPLQGCLLGAFDAPHPWYGKGETHQVEITETIILPIEFPHLCISKGSTVMIALSSLTETKDGNMRKLWLPFGYWR